MSKSLLYASNQNIQNISDGEVISFGNVVRRFGCNCKLYGGNAEIEGSGYYKITANFAFAGTAATTAVDAKIQLFKDGSPITGAFAIRSTLANNTYDIAISAVERMKCCCGAMITAKVTGTDIIVSNASIIVEKE